ncbi:MAG: hypothetical protein HQL82_17230 [Magnetococcales bacterium]|nr:hypothetical protein [Magnetococcales bacterium]
MSASGHTFIEMIVALTTLGLLTAGGFATWSNGDLAGRARSAQFAGHLRLAQSLAMSRGAPFQVAIDGNSYRVEEAASGAVVAGDTVAGAAFSGQFPITFDSLGRPTNPGLKGLTIDGTTHWVLVHGETGLVTLP